MRTSKAAIDTIRQDLLQKVNSVNNKEFKASANLLLPNIILTVNDTDIADMLDVSRAEAQAIKDSFVKIISAELKNAVDASLVQYGLVQTGQLRSSLQVTVVNDTIQIQYSAPYAALMHFGGYIKPYGNIHAKPVYIPGRPWVDIAIANYDFNAAFKRALDSI